MFVSGWAKLISPLFLYSFIFPHGLKQITLEFSNYIVIQKRPVISQIHFFHEGTWYVLSPSLPYFSVLIFSPHRFPLLLFKVIFRNICIYICICFLPSLFSSLFPSFLPCFFPSFLPSFPSSLPSFLSINLPTAS